MFQILLNFKNFLFVLVLFVGFIASGCNDDNEKEEDSSIQASFSGSVVDGYIANATVFIDLNNNGTQDSDEPETTTNESGNFSFDNINLNSEEKYSIVAIGGTDTVTGEEFTETFKSVATKEELSEQNLSVAVSPISTVMHHFVVDSNLETADANSKMKNLFDLQDDYDFFKDDPLTQSKTDKTDNLELYSASLKVISYLNVVKNLSDDLGVSEEESIKLGLYALKDSSDNSPFKSEAGQSNVIDKILLQSNVNISDESKTEIISNMNSKFTNVDSKMNSIKEIYEYGQEISTNENETSADMSGEIAFYNENYSKEDLENMSLADLMKKDDLPIKTRMEEAQNSSNEAVVIIIEKVDENIENIANSVEEQKIILENNFNELKNSTEVADVEDAKYFTSVIRDAINPIVGEQLNSSFADLTVTQKIQENLTPAVENKLSIIENNIKTLETDLNSFEAEFDSEFSEVFTEIEERLTQIYNAIDSIFENDLTAGSEVKTDLGDVVTLESITENSDGSKERVISIKNGESSTLTGKNYSMSFENIFDSEHVLDENDMNDMQSEYKSNIEIIAKNIKITGAYNSTLKADEIVFKSDSEETSSGVIQDYNLFYDEYSFSEYYENSEDKMLLSLKNANLKIADKYSFVGNIELAFNSIYEYEFEQYYYYNESESESDDLNKLVFDGELKVNENSITGKINYGIEYENINLVIENLKINIDSTVLAVEKLTINGQEKVSIIAENLALEYAESDYLKIAKLNVIFEDSYSEMKNDSNSTYEYSEINENYLYFIINDLVLNIIDENSKTLEVKADLTFKRKYTDEYSEVEYTYEYNSIYEDSTIAYFNGSYNYDGFKANGILNLESSLTYESGYDYYNGEYYENLNSNHLGYISLNVEPNGFTPYSVNVVSFSDENDVFKTYIQLAKDDYKFIAELIEDEENKITLLDSNGIQIQINKNSTQDEDNLDFEITNKNAESLATFGEESNSNNWEINYSDNTSESVF